LRKPDGTPSPLEGEGWGGGDNGSIQWPVVAAGGIIASACLWALGDFPWKHISLYGVGLALGIVLYHAAFGFTSAYRRMIRTREVAGVQAQLVMLGAATVLFAPALAEGSLFGNPVGGAVAPIGLQVAAGALIFGLGMQLGGGCGSGTLYTVGGGSARMVVTLIAFCAGSFWASLDMRWWVSTPRLPGIALGDALGWPAAVALQLAVLVGLYLWLSRWARGGQPAPPQGSSARFLRGPWPLIWGALTLAVLNFATLALSGHPWTITWAFTLWGAKVATLVGWDPAGSWFWTGGFTENALNAGILNDKTSIMDIGIVIGALVAAGMAGRFAPNLRIPWRSLMAAIIGGLMMGYGARIAFGCNIGAFFSGVASTSLHGWLWIACALPGTWLGVKMRPWFGLD